VLHRIVDDGVALEVCPLSNVSLGVYDQPRDVPLRALLNAGAIVALAADDPVVFGTRLVDQYRSARMDHGLDDAGLAGLAKGSIAASRATEATKARLTRGVDEWLAAEDPAEW
jgi:adenosine deaminase